MNLLKSIRLSISPTVAFVGAGGKTTAMFQLARQLEGPVIVTATTHLGVWQIPLADRHNIANSPASIELLEHSFNGVVLVTSKIQDDKTLPIETDILKRLHAICDVHSLPLLIEADGSHQKPLKAPAEHEPAYPGFVDLVVQIAGLSGLGQPVGEEYVQRPEIFSRLSELNPGELITSEALARVLTHPEGGLKNIPLNARRVVILNQADTTGLQSQADGIAKRLLSTYNSVVIASLKEEKIHAVREPIAGVILAAGEAQRYGQPKQLLDWRGEPFVRVVAKTALRAGLSPVLVVTGAYAEKATAAVGDLPVQIVHNLDWQSGQASSIKVGIRSVGEKSGAAIFLLSDQPQVTPTILHALVEEHSSTLAPIVAPMVLDQRANPVLFDRITFSDLMKLEGNVGGRGIFSKHRVTYLPWHDDAMLLDVDTPEHYQRLKDLLE